MKKITLLSLILGAGVSLGALAGGGPPLTGDLSCDPDTKDEVEFCYNGEKWEFELKCVGAWTAEGSYDISPMANPFPNAGFSARYNDMVSYYECNGGFLLGVPPAAPKNEYSCTTVLKGKPTDKAVLEAKHGPDPKCPAG